MELADTRSTRDMADEARLVHNGQNRFGTTRTRPELGASISRDNCSILSFVATSNHKHSLRVCFWAHWPSSSVNDDVSVRLRLGPELLCSGLEHHPCKGCPRAVRSPVVCGMPSMSGDSSTCEECGNLFRVANAELYRRPACRQPLQLGVGAGRR